MRLALRPVVLGRLSVLAPWLAVACGGQPPPLPAPPAPPAAPQPATTEPAASAAPIDAGAPAVAISAAPTQLTSKAIALPGANGHASMDYLFYEPAHGRVWVPVGDTGSVDVLDPASGQFTRVDGFKTAERELHGKKRTMGPSSGSAGDGVAYVGDRASSEICAVDTGTLKLGACLKLLSAPDGVLYVPSAKELWVTTPRDGSITVLDASKPAKLKPKTVIKTPGSPEGYALDDARGLFFTNLEDKDQTVVVDVKTHAIRSTWTIGCGGDGPRGLAVDATDQLVMVACTDHLQVLDGAHEGAPVAKLDTGAGVDNVDWLPSARLLYVGAGKAATLDVIHVDDKGQPTLVAAGASTEGARNGVVDSTGNATLADPSNGGVLVFAYKP